MDENRKAPSKLEHAVAFGLGAGVYIVVASIVETALFADAPSSWQANLVEVAIGLPLAMLMYVVVSRWQRNRM